MQKDDRQGSKGLGWGWGFIHGSLFSYSASSKYFLLLVIEHFSISSSVPDSAVFQSNCV